MVSGRHADPDRGAFWRSAAAAVAKALLVLALLAGLTTAVALFARGSALPDGAVVVLGDVPPGTAGPPSPLAETPTPPASAAPVATDQHVTVQVLDGGGGPEVTREVVGLLEQWGYAVVAVNPARCCYEETTLFYSAGKDADAEDLRARDRRFAAVAANRNLNEAVDLHVVVGKDWDGS